MTDSKSTPPSILDAPTQLPDDICEVFAKCEEKIGFVPNVLRVYATAPGMFRAFRLFYNELMKGESSLSELEREMIAVVVSSVNRCHYCLVAHGAAVRVLSGNPQLDELLANNYRTAPLSPKQLAMLDFVYHLTATPQEIDTNARQKLSVAGFSHQAIFEIANVAGFFNMSNRVATAVDMQPNAEYHDMARRPTP